MKAYAVDPGKSINQDLEEIISKTTSPTVRAAIVNWLVTYENMFVSAICTDEDIYRMWTNRQTKSATVVEISLHIEQAIHIKDGYLTSR